MKTSSNNNINNSEFMRGIACVVAWLIRDRDEPSLAKYFLDANGLTLADFNGNEIEPFDMKPIRKLLKAEAVSTKPAKRPRRQG